jgi:acetyl-CoA carboxylase carboxyl transferase subunit beta
MLRAMDAVARLRWAGLPLVVYLANPTTGGVFASWASAGHVTLAEPGATVAFTGPRVAEGLGTPVEPVEVQRAESLFQRGHVDRLVPVEELRDAVAAVVRGLTPADAPGRRSVDDVADGPRGWLAVDAARRHTGPTVLDRVLERADEVTFLQGDRAGCRTETALAALCRVDGRPLVLVGHRRSAGAVGTAGLRVARRVMRLAVDLGLPIVTIIDTDGAEISAAEEESGLAGAISASMATLLAAPVSSVAVLAGSGAGGAAIAWAATDRLLAVPDSWMAPISPEAASLIVHRDVDHAAQMADAQKVGAVELVEQGIVDRLIAPERIVDALSDELDDLAAVPADELMVRRSDRMRRLGDG